MEYNSPIQRVADLPEHYAARPGAFQFSKDVAVDWEQTRVLADEHTRTPTVPLSFLPPGRRFEALIYRDGDGAHERGNPFAFVRETRIVTADDALTLTLTARDRHTRIFPSAEHGEHAWAARLEVPLRFLLAPPAPRPRPRPP